MKTVFSSRSQGLIAGIIPMSFVDGPGNRCVIFMQGCNLRCIYCQNPETQDITGKNNPLCRQLSVKDLINKVRGYLTYISGFTFTGGEPLLQYEFIKTFVSEIKLIKPSITVAIDSNMDVESNVIKNVANHVNYFMPDLKAPNKKLYNIITGGLGDFNRVIDNITYVYNKGKLYEVRLPIIPTLTDKIDVIYEWMNIIQKHLSKSVKIHLIRFRPHGVKGKLANFKSPSRNLMLNISNLFKSRGFTNVYLIDIGN